jgi:hypothetical protein
LKLIGKCTGENKQKKKRKERKEKAIEWEIDLGQ